MSEYTLKISPDQAKEMPMVDLAFEILRAANTPFYYRDLMKEIAKLKGLDDEKMMDVIAQVYTEINIDGRFACVGTNLWGLKRWYPVEKADEAVSGSAKRPRIINDEDDLDDEDLFTEEEDDSFEGEREEGEDYDALDEDRDEFFDEDEEEVDEHIADEDSDADDSELEEEADEDSELDDDYDSDGDDDDIR